MPNAFNHALKAFAVDTNWNDSSVAPIMPDLLVEPMTVAVSTITTIAVKTTTPATALYLTETGDTTDVSINDIHQGQIGDCYALSSIGEIALKNPAFIKNMIKVNSDGTESVTLYTAANGKAPGIGNTSYKAVTEKVTNTFAKNGVNNGATQDVVNGTKEIWVQVMEKAFAMLNGGVSSSGAYTGIANGGSPIIAMEQLTGKAASYTTAAKLTLDSLQAHVTANDLIVMDTKASSGLPFNLVSGHAYMFQAIVGSGANAQIQLANPWGTNQPSLIPFSKLSQGIAEIDFGHC